MIKNKRNITILVDSISSWYVKYARSLSFEINKLGHNSSLVHSAQEIKKGDICYLLSCTKILPPDYLKLNRNNIVIHASDLPKGKGFSPMQWQILEGHNIIKLTLFEAAEELDAGDYYFKSEIHFDGTELLSELKHKMALKINEMAIFYLQNISKLNSHRQQGESTFYRRRIAEDDKIDPNKTILQLFNNFRIADNENHPIFFEHLGVNYNIRIEKK